MISDFAGRLLVIEDEPLVRMFAVDALSDMGFEVDEAATAVQAREVLSSQNRHIAALADVKLPDRSDVGWALELREVIPDLPLLVLSGMDEYLVLDAYKGIEKVGFLQKPYNQNALQMALEQLGIRIPTKEGTQG